MNSFILNFFLNKLALYEIHNGTSKCYQKISLKVHSNFYVILDSVTFSYIVSSQTLKLFHLNRREQNIGPRESRVIKRR